VSAETQDLCAESGGPPRCSWCAGDPDYLRYHDAEWGVPAHGDRTLFEMLVLEGAQAGLNWLTILKRRPHYRAVFDGFDPEKIARYGDAKVAELLRDPGIIRNRLKVHSTVINARAMLSVAEELGSFDRFIWRFVDHCPRQNRWRHRHQVPPWTAESCAMSEELRRRGFRFVGKTICYAYMQAVGMVNDHLEACYRHREVALLGGALSEGEVPPSER